MSEVSLHIDDLLLDTHNPRIGDVHGQRDALQKVLDDQGDKLAALADSIATDGMNPMDRMLVMPEGKKFVVLEGNRRLAALKILSNPHVLASLELKESLRKRLEKIAKKFDTKTVEPIAGFQVASREEAKPWLFLRHTGQNQGRGVVDWSGIQTQRFRGDMPALQALELVKQHGALTDEQKAALDATFPITTLDRLLSAKDVRAKIGVEVKKGKLLSPLPPAELIKPLRRIVLDLSEGRVNVSQLKNKTDQNKYIDGFDTASKPDLTKAESTAREVETIKAEDFKKPTKPKKRGAKAGGGGDRNVLIPRGSTLNITDGKIANIATELRGLKLADYPNAISVLFRVFLELSVDHYMDKHKMPTSVVANGRKVDKNLAKKVEEVVNDLVSKGANRKDFLGVTRALSVSHSPLYMDLLHAYVHNRFVQPKSRDLASTWDDARRLFESIWP